jgi:hypothetical protein
MNRPNKDGKPLAEGEEGRPMIKENVNQPPTSSTPSEINVSQRLEGVRKEQGRIRRRNSPLCCTT